MTFTSTNVTNNSTDRRASEHHCSEHHDIGGLGANVQGLLSARIHEQLQRRLPSSCDPLRPTVSDLTLAITDVDSETRLV